MGLASEILDNLPLSLLSDSAEQEAEEEEEVIIMADGLPWTIDPPVLYQHREATYFDIEEAPSHWQARLRDRRECFTRCIRTALEVIQHALHEQRSQLRSVETRNQSEWWASSVPPHDRSD